MVIRGLFHHPRARSINPSLRDLGSAPPVPCRHGTGTFTPQPRLLHGMARHDYLVAVCIALLLHAVHTGTGHAQAHATKTDVAGRRLLPESRGAFYRPVGRDIR